MPRGSASDLRSPT